jgi:hypothetical protein
VQFDLLNPFLAFARSYEDMKFLAVNFYLALYGQIKKINLSRMTRLAFDVKEAPATPFSAGGLNR